MRILYTGFPHICIFTYTRIGCIFKVIMVSPEKISGRLGNKMFQMAFMYAQVKEGIIPDIYVQDLKYFEKYEKEIKDLFSEGIGYLPYVAIHIRVGANPINPEEPKYMDNPFYTSLVRTGYYIDAINLFPNRKFLVFSDDIAFAKTYLEGDKFAFDESDNDIDSFNKMASCDSQIIANSSYSWWAAYLNKNPSKTVVAPTIDKWYNDGKERIACPKEWIRI